MNKTLLSLALLASLGATVAQAEEVKFVTNAAYPPFEFVDENNEMQGFDIDLAKALCDVAALECSFHNQAFDSLIPSLKFRRYHAAIAAMDVTPERSEQVDFSDIYYENSAVFVAPQGKFGSLDELLSQTVGVQNGTSHQKYIQDKLEGEGLQSRPYQSVQDALLDMTNGRLDAVFADTAVVGEWLAKTEGYEVVGEAITDDNYFGTGFGIAVTKGNQELLDKLNQGLAELRANGTYDSLYGKYFPQ
ncbi:arginine ABC transporter substrate-binding protein [Zobellella endophytica]|uniref:Arginine ABC transporter substrate-binding protein n=1 Tax=Zobellella endophytica TaxID=2116700 RepID=A0A2P7R8Q4_9GAMM|nr:transporter substrate-binding domain-containing protein [Zobellella endophytica]PSJ46608.1 arginine ABC transporter substrate-binding protein [Zobellella endophytica]